MPCKNNLRNASVLGVGTLLMAWSVIELDCEQFGSRYLGSLCDFYDNAPIVKKVLSVALLALGATAVMAGGLDCARDNEAPTDSSNNENSVPPTVQKSTKSCCCLFSGKQNDEEDDNQQRLLGDNDPKI